VSIAPTGVVTRQDAGMVPGECPPDAGGRRMPKNRLGIVPCWRFAELTQVNFVPSNPKEIVVLLRCDKLRGIV
jgi:hypothetical protein